MLSLEAALRRQRLERERIRQEEAARFRNARKAAVKAAESPKRLSTLYRPQVLAVRAVKRLSFEPQRRLGPIAEDAAECKLAFAKPRLKTL